MKKWLKWSGGSMAVVFVGLQFFNPGLKDPTLIPSHDVSAINAPPAQIAALLHNACYDCHSDQTRWPWYSRLAPVSWWLADHVNEGRRKLNFSEWPHDDPALAAKKWSRVSTKVDYGEMPLRSYTWMHPASRLSKAERDEIIQWADSEARKLRAEAAND